MPADRFFHARLGHSAKVSSLSDLAYRVWTTYVLAADDFGVMRADAVAFQAAHDALRTRSVEEMTQGIERLVTVGLVATFEHQGARYLYQPDWQDFQRVRYPGRTLHPLPASAEVSARTHHLWSIHPGGARVPVLPKLSGTPPAQLQKFFRTTAEALPQNFGSAAAPVSHQPKTRPESLPHKSGRPLGELPQNFHTTSEELPSHARACETANGLWLMKEGGAGGEGSARGTQASRRGGAARSTGPAEAYDAVIERAKP